MQDKVVNFVNEAISINAKLLSQTLDFGVQSNQRLVQQVSNQTIKGLAFRNFDDYVASQKSWGSFAMEQAREFTQTMTGISTDACRAYLELWQEATASDVDTITVKAKTA